MKKLGKILGSFEIVAPEFQSKGLRN